MGSSTEKVDSREAASLLLAYFVLFPVITFWGDTLGVLTPNDDRDLSFLFAGNGTEATSSIAMAFGFSEGKILVLRSCKLWSGLQIDKTRQRYG